MTRQTAAATAAWVAQAALTSETLLTLLEIHTEGATVSELAAYTERERSGVLLHLKDLQTQGKVFSTPADRNTRIWHLTTQQAEVRSLKPAQAPRIPLRPASRTKGR